MRGGDGSGTTTASPLQSLLTPLLAATATASSPAHLALPLWLASFAALTIAIGAFLARPPALTASRGK